MSLITRSPSRRVLGLSVVAALAAASAAAQAPVPLPRTLDLPLPLFPQGAWVESAATAPVHATSDQQIAVTYRVLCGDTTDLQPAGSPPSTDWPFPDVNYDDYSIPIATAGSGQQSVGICDYEGNQAYPGPKWNPDTLGGPVSIPESATSVRPAGPQDTDADGHLVVYHPASSTTYDLWQATTVRSGVCASLGGGLVGSSILEAGAADYFETGGDGYNPPGVSSARAMGTPLLAGLILPEDVESGSIEHALAVAIPGPRNLSPDPYEPLGSDWYRPTSTTETDFYSTNPAALAAGQRLRLKDSLVDDQGDPIDEAGLAPITRMFLAALRTYGAYVVDNAGGFTFYAEDIHTAVLDLPADDLNILVGASPGTPIPSTKTAWQLAMETLNLELEGIPFAYGTCDGASSTVTVANFEVVEPAFDEHLFSDGFESGSAAAWTASVPRARRR